MRFKSTLSGKILVNSSTNLKTFSLQQIVWNEIDIFSQQYVTLPFMIPFLCNSSNVGLLDISFFNLSLMFFLSPSRTIYKNTKQYFFSENGQLR